MQLKRNYSVQPERQSSNALDGIEPFQLDVHEARLNRSGMGGSRHPGVRKRLAGAITLAVSLGQIRTLIEHPMTHATIPIEAQLEAGIEPGGVRLSIGLEDPADIIKDITAAIQAID